MLLSGRQCRQKKQGLFRPYRPDIEAPFPAPSHWYCSAKYSSASLIEVLPADRILQATCNLLVWISGKSESFIAIVSYTARSAKMATDQKPSDVHNDDVEKLKEVSFLGRVRSAAFTAHMDRNNPSARDHRLPGPRRRRLSSGGRTCALSHCRRAFTSSASSTAPTSATPRSSTARTRMTCRPRLA